MPLSLEDLKRISDLNYEIKYFSIKTKGEYRLKNRKGRCIFLQKNSCEIYSHRPEGCKIYPLVYAEYSKKGIIDYICPFGDEFKIRKKDISKLKRLIKII